MTKLVTDSEVLHYLLFDGTAPDDTPLHDLIGKLKEATLNCAEMRVIVDFEKPEDMRSRLSSVELALTEAWRQLLSLQNEFGDLIEKNFE